MVGPLLLRGMLVGLVAGLLSFGFLKIFGEPSVDRAIAFEATIDAATFKALVDDAAAKGLPAPAPEVEELVSRRTQAGIGLFTGVAIYNTAFGGLFALAFALAYRRMGGFDARATALLLAIFGLIAIAIVPGLKYPANPPSIGDHETIGIRTGLYFAMIALSLAAMIAAGQVRLWLQPKHGGWNAALAAGVAYLALVGMVAYALPTVSEVPETFPATVLWHFRIVSMGAQLIMWMTLGLGFGAWTARAERRATTTPLTTAARRA